VNDQQREPERQLGPRDKPNDLHVVPARGDHAVSVDCRCRPRMTYQDHGEGRIWSHHHAV
jgi:hypothetical protein